MAVEYVARFEMGEITGKSEEQLREEAKSNPEKSIEKKSDPTRTIAKGITTLVMATAVSGQIYQEIQSRNNAIKGDSISQARLDNSMAYLNEGLSVFGTLGVAGILSASNPVLLPIAVGGLLVNYTLRAFRNTQTNLVKTAGWQNEAVINAEKQRRLVQNITGGRV